MWFRTDWSELLDIFLGLGLMLKFKVNSKISVGRQDDF
jgi:hypothetical protein